MIRALCLIAVLFLFSGCRLETTHGPQTPQRGEFSETAEFQVDACRGMNGISEPCYWRYHIKNSRCRETEKCSKLVLFFSGGDMTCDDSFSNPDGGYSRILARYAEDGYLAVCIGIFLSDGATAGKVPYAQEASRIDTAIEAVRGSDVIQRIWTGEDLLFAGVSHGATAPVISMARSSFDEKTTWKGSHLTAACFHDGIYDPLALNDFFKTNPISCSLVRNATICGRYTPPGNSCADPTLTSPGIAADTILSVSPDNFSIKHWKLIECGSALPEPVCGAIGDLDRDWVPAGPIHALCSAIDAAPGHSCIDDAQPNDGHLSCATKDQGIDKCRLWFNGLVN